LFHEVQEYRLHTDYSNAVLGEFSMAETHKVADKHNVQHVSDKDFDASVLNVGKPAFVDFWAPWCGPCRIVGPIVEELAPSFEGRAVITKINVDENPQIAQRYGVTSIPTLMMFKDGKLVDRAVGALPRNELQKFIERNL
jgi:thioredoxin 1